MQIVPTTPAMPALPTAAVPTTAAAPTTAAGAASDAAVRSAFGLLLGAMTRARPATALEGRAAAAETEDDAVTDSASRDETVAEPGVATALAADAGPVEASARDGAATSQGQDAASSTPLAALREFVHAQTNAAVATETDHDAQPQASTSRTDSRHAHADAHGHAAHPEAITRSRGTASLATDVSVSGTTDLRPVRDLAALHPQLRMRVERVITRMAQEHGHEVRVTETLRSQARQEHLHAQGRTRPGPIVTWTTQSKHTEGLAADLQVDGGWTDTEAYARLQRIAQEEGLHTLGPRDPGHVELRLTPDEHQAWKALAGHAHEVQHRAAIAHQAGSSGADVPRPGRAHARPAAGAHAPRVAAVAAVAPVAQVAQVSQVAGIAPIATLAQYAGPDAIARAEVVATAAAPSSRAAAHYAPLEPQSPEVPTEAASAAASAAAAASTAPSDTGHGNGQSPQHDAPRTTLVSAATPDAAVDAARTMQASDRAERAERIEQIQDARASRPLQSLTLRVADADGTDHRIRVDLRGGQVVTDIALGDSSRVTPLAQRLPELVQRLSEHGYEAGALQVRALAPEPPPLAPWSGRSTSDERPTHQGHSQHHPQSRQRGRRDPGGDPA